MTITPSLVMRWPASRSSRLAASSGSVSRRASYRHCTAVGRLLTICPPGPEARTKEISRSFSSIERSRAIRSMASHRISGPIPWWNRAYRRITVLRAICLTEGLIRLQWRGGHRLGGGLRRTADDDGQQTIAPQPARSPFGLVDRDLINKRVTPLHVVDREMIKLILQHGGGELRRRIEREHPRTLEVGFGLGELLFGRTALGHAADFAGEGVYGFAGAVRPRSGRTDGQRVVFHPDQRVRDRVGKAAFLANFAVQP